MWYDNKRPHPVKAPTFRERLILRSLIFIGLGAMGLFLWGIFQPEHIGYRPLYYLLMFSMVYLCFRIVYEWYHYFSISKPEEPPLRREYKVDILTTFCPGEPYAMIEETLEAIQKITYPHTTYLCDEANDPHLIEVCRRLGVIHVTRSNRENAKAGNINNALKQAQGEICLILDPDHVPAPDILDRLLPYFQDDKVGFVQAVQAYYNLGENIIAKASAQQTFQFYGPIMMTMHRYGTAQAIGANCCFRREALNSIGGHAPGLAEDMNTSMKLHARGWKSVYVPLVLNRGLVPSSLSAYYKQQLKWSRGVFELLVTTYRENFWRFNWRQKLHYGLLPWHYFAGIVFGINFLIPILVLFFGLIPMRIDLGYFLLLGSPFWATILAVRFFVQRWVMEEEERGFHLVGGLLFIGTWWIHLLGFIFTLLRRKVPYNPTPKAGEEENIFALNLPNLAIGLLSLAAIIYGLNRDFNPYSLVMAAFAGMNFAFVSLVLAMSFQNRWRRFKTANQWAENFSISIWWFKRWFWLLRHRAYGAIRLAALPILLLVLGALYWQAREVPLAAIEPPYEQPPVRARYLGFMTSASWESAHAATTGCLAAFEQALDQTPQIIGLQAKGLGFTQGPQFKVALQEISAREAYPLLAWQSGWSDSLKPDSSYWLAMAKGAQDAALRQMARDFRDLERPLFLIWAPEPDKSLRYGDSPDLISAKAYRQAWQRIHHLFAEEGAHNLIWVFQPGTPENADLFFPGAGYVDWLAVSAPLSRDSGESYASFRRQLVFQQDLPVMLMASARQRMNLPDLTENKRTLSLLNSDYPEIQALVLGGNLCDFSPLSDEAPEEQQSAALVASWKEWTQNFLPPRRISHDDSLPLSTLAEHQFFEGMRGIGYPKGQDWQASMHPLFREEVARDFRRIRAMGLNCIKRYGPTVYDHNLFAEAKRQELGIIYSFWLPADLDYLRDTLALRRQQKQIVKEVKALRSKEAIAAWHIGNPVWTALQGRYAEPQLSYQREAYRRWLAGLSQKIRALDSRPLSIEMAWRPQWRADLAQLLPGTALSAVGLDYPSSGIKNLVEEDYHRPGTALFWNQLPALDSLAWSKLPGGWLLPSWQDDVYEESVSYNGLLDHQGRQKDAYRLCQQYLTESPAVENREVGILRPAVIPFGGQMLRYEALLFNTQRWELAAFDPQDLVFEWHLVKTDSYGNPLAMEYVGEGVSLDLKAPADPQLYRLYLQVSRGSQVWVAKQSLLTPIYRGKDLREMSRDEVNYLYERRQR